MNVAATKAIRLAGGITKVAEALRISKQAVSAWRDVPPRYVVTLERLSGIPRQKIRPDVFREERT